MQLEEIRREIDTINKELLALFVRRMKAAEEVARIKAATEVPVFDETRERQILDWVEQESGEYAGSAKTIFQTMMDLSRAQQHQSLGSGDALRRMIESASHQPLSTYKDATVACPGIWGSFTSEAAAVLFPGNPLLFFEQFGEVFDAVQSGAADFGVVPVENSNAGSVLEVFDLLLKHHLTINGSLYLPIVQCLCALPGASIDQIKYVYSHPQGLHQCTEFIARIGANTVECSNTAIAAKRVAGACDYSAGAIASTEAAKQCGLQILQSGIQNSGNNTTRFIVFSKKLMIEPGADKISLAFSLPHVTGSLYRILARFAANGLSLTKIESRPIKDTLFEYAFYLDFVGNIFSGDTLELLSALQDDLPQFSFLGNYREFTRENSNE